MRIERGALAVLIGVALTRVAAADCTSPRCPDPRITEVMRAGIVAACDCSGTASHAKYVRCAKKAIKAAVRDGSLPGACKKTVKRCEAETTCGLANAMVCCETTTRGAVKSKVIKTAARCRGATCESATHAADGCTADAECASRPRGGTKSFRTVQRVFTQSCALGTCHSVIAREGDLVLEHEDVSYSSLLNQPAAHVEAQGQLRVIPGDPANSYLIRKLRGQGPGDPMPQTGRPMPEGVIKMIEDWIARGAHTTIEECPQAAPGGTAEPSGVPVICDDEIEEPGDFVWQPQPPLEPPPPNEGVQLFVPARDVPAGHEWEMCYAFRPNWGEIGAAVGMPAGQPPIISNQVYRMHEGSHHLLLYMYWGQHPEVWPDGYFPCRAANCINPGDCPPDADQYTLPIGGTQVAGTRYEVSYPNGVGIPVLTPNAVIIANPHYTNPFQPPQPIYGEAWLNLSFYSPSEFKAILGGIFATNYRDLIVEAYESRTITSIWRPRNILSGAAADAAVFQLFGHMHKRATMFQIDYVRDGKCSVSNALCGRDADCACRPWQRPCTPDQTCVRGPTAEDTMIYRTADWDHAPVVDFTPPYLRVARTEGLRWTCTHVNGVRGDDHRPPKKCHEGCEACGWDAASQTCIFQRGVQLGVDSAPRVFQKNEPMPLVFGLLADDDMCNMFGYYIDQADLPKLGLQ